MLGPSGFLFDEGDGGQLLGHDQPVFRGANLLRYLLDGGVAPGQSDQYVFDSKMPALRRRTSDTVDVFTVCREADVRSVNSGLGGPPEILEAHTRWMWNAMGDA